MCLVVGLCSEFLRSCVLALVILFLGSLVNLKISIGILLSVAKAFEASNLGLSYCKSWREKARYFGQRLELLAIFVGLKVL